MRTSIEITGAEPLAAYISDAAYNVNARIYHTTRHYGVLLQNEVRARARGLFFVTDYDTHINMRMGSAGMHFPLAEVGTDEPQGFRLEQGFDNIDALGRIYSQPPRPHFAPALNKVGRDYLRAVRQITREM